MKILQHTADLHCVMNKVITIMQSFDDAVLNTLRTGDADLRF